ncbi:arginine decarboxylase, pyruvoyl-dependent [Thermanaerosceptrum fracticalcis]|uniref:Pyruvoyl-dependent arginine decarboxylase AaxB n=1 Tax=Thermanaerosceptrum fracticalcis TaxID=1712410 RepID=A0A7G6E1W9_THEFR|nr:arginine decarboxylase, pyruvoyl-dependent [Thermanaerosceptrum fracticalcis]QNB46073.1 arginine decarboxylase, pyruvoyl-dependent [Thermanaerosceptrum fracticalcis]
MLPTPKMYKVVAGSSEGRSSLTAFDGALLKAGIGNINLIRVSSILPPGAVYKPDLEIPPGSLVPTAYGSIVCKEPGKVIAAAVGVGVSENNFGVIMEYSGYSTKQEAEETIRKMVEEAFALRGMKLVDVKIAAVEHTVEKIGCALAAVPLWY